MKGFIFALLASAAAFSMPPTHSTTVCFVENSPADRPEDVIAMRREVFLKQTFGCFGTTTMATVVSDGQSSGEMHCRFDMDMMSPGANLICGDSKIYMDYANMTGSIKTGNMMHQKMICRNMDALKVQ